MGIAVLQGDSLMFSAKPVAFGHEVSGQEGQERLRRLILLSWTLAFSRAIFPLAAALLFTCFPRELFLHKLLPFLGLLIPVDTPTPVTLSTRIELLHLVCQLRNGLPREQLSNGFYVI